MSRTTHRLIQLIITWQNIMMSYIRTDVFHAGVCKPEQTKSKIHYTYSILLQYRTQSKRIWCGFDSRISLFSVIFSQRSIISCVSLTWIQIWRDTALNKPTGAVCRNQRKVNQSEQDSIYKHYSDPVTSDTAQVTSPEMSF